MFRVSENLRPDEVLSDGSFASLFWKKAFVEAHALKASDIHAESIAEGFRLRFRVDGVMRESRENCSFNGDEGVTLMDRLKEIAGLDTALKSRLQDGSFVLEAMAAAYRISLSPGYLYGECAVIRVIDNAASPNLADLNLPPRVFSDFSWALAQDQGLVLVTGPTGSGKSTTLQACINSLAKSELKIISIEDPPERILSGVIYEKITREYGWADAIKGAMRSDVDVILIGEIRDRESARLAVEAGQTGHLVLSTLHTNGVAETVFRLLTLGVERYLIAESLLLVTAQRLLPGICQYCRTTGEAGFEQNPSGCDRCNLGIKGRVPVIEYILRPNPDLIYNFDRGRFREALAQTLDGEMNKLAAEGRIDHRLVADHRDQQKRNIAEAG